MKLPQANRRAPCQRETYHRSSVKTSWSGTAMLEDFLPAVASPLDREGFDSLEYVLLGCLRSSGNNDVEGNSSESSTSEENEERRDDYGTYCNRNEPDEFRESEISRGLMTMNSARDEQPFPSADEISPADSFVNLPEQHHCFCTLPVPEPEHDTTKPRKWSGLVMIFENIKNSIFKRRTGGGSSFQHTHGRSLRWTGTPRAARVHTALSTAASINSTTIQGDMDTWSSTCRRYTCLKYFVWNGGSPQFSFAIDQLSGSVIVSAVLSRVALVAGIQAGDTLEAIADTPTIGMDLDQVVETLTEVESPAVLRFRADEWARSASGLPCFEREEYHVILRGKKLGVTFTSDGPHCIPVVTRTASSGAPAAVSGVHPGDVLVAVNGQDAISMGLARVMNFVTEAPRPICFTFQRLRVAVIQQTVRTRGFASIQSFDDTLSKQIRNNGPEPTEAADEVLIVWKDGPLGVTLVPDPLSGLPILNRLTGKGTSRGLEQLREGYTLHSVNGKRLVGSPMGEWQAQLSRLQKPALLVFKAPKIFGSFCDAGSASEVDSGSGSLTFTSPSSSSHAPLTVIETAATEHILGSLGSARVPSDNNSMLETTSDALDERDCYYLSWNGPRLGLGLSIEPENQSQRLGDTDQKGPRGVPVVRVVQGSCNLCFPGNPLGDILVAVNDIQTRGLAEDELRDLIFSAPKPASLRFCRPRTSQTSQRCWSRSSSRSEWGDLHDSEDEATLDASWPTHFRTTHYFYNLLWPAKTALGVTFASYLDADRGGQVVVYVKRVAPNGHAAKTDLVVKGDQLATVNGSSLPLDRGFDDTMHWLARQKRPLVLGFARPLVERDTERLR